MPLIEFKNITKKYQNGFSLFNGLDLSVQRGEFIFLIGPSGSGKSTLVKMLIREETPDSGEVLFNGENILEIPQNQIHTIRRDIGVIFQDFKLLDSKTVFENVAVALEVVDAPSDTIKRVVPNVLGLVGLGSKMSNFPRELSGGEKQRVAIARALAHEPDVLVADEATGNIDPKASAEIIEVLEKINSLGTTIIMATHDYNIVNKLKKRVVRLEKGNIVSDKEEGKYEA